MVDRTKALKAYHEVRGGIMPVCLNVEDNCRNIFEFMGASFKFKQQKTGFA
jgi:hypothetical protein